jgi:mono/diheme cytochrome c family protein
MNFLKLGLLIASLAFFIAACTQANQGNNAGTANNQAVALNSMPSVNNNQSPQQQQVNAEKQTAPAAASESEQAQTVSAAETYKTICAKCHKENGEGGTITSNGKNHKVPNFKSERMKKDSDSEFIDAIAHGIPDEGMPAFKDKLNEQQIKELVQYIRKDIQGK